VCRIPPRTFPAGPVNFEPARERGFRRGRWRLAGLSGRSGLQKAHAHRSADGRVSAEHGDGIALAGDCAEAGGRIRERSARGWR